MNILGQSIKDLILLGVPWKPLTVTEFWFSSVPFFTLYLQYYNEVILDWLSVHDLCTMTSLWYPWPLTEPRFLPDHFPIIQYGFYKYFQVLFLCDPSLQFLKSFIFVFFAVFLSCFSFSWISFWCFVCYMLWIDNGCLNTRILSPFLPLANTTAVHIHWFDFFMTFVFFILELCKLYILVWLHG